MTTEIPTIPELTTDWIRRVVAYTDEITYFGENSVGFAFAKATAEQTGQTQAQYRAILRRDTLLGAQGDALTQVAEEYGVPQLGPTRAVVCVIVQPWKATVLAITDNSKIAVDSSAKFAANDSIRLTSKDGSLSEVRTIQSISIGTGPSGVDELVVDAILNTYVVADARVLLRRTLIAGTVFKATAGLTFHSLQDVTTGDKNPVMTGESQSLALADKVWCECTTTGVAGNVEALTVNALQTPDPDIKGVFNPGRGFGGTDEETALSLKYRTATQGQIGAVETTAHLEVLARRGNTDVLRAFAEEADEVSTLRIRVLTRQGGGLSTDALQALGLYIDQRMRSQMRVEVLNVVLTSIEISSNVTLDPGPGTPAQRLRAAWTLGADKYATYLDWRKWAEGALVDEAPLIAILDATDGIATIETSSFLPAADTLVAEASVPAFTSFTLTDTVSGETFGAALETSY